jgi:hypothetical protein
MSKKVLILILLLSLNGCASLQEVNKGEQKAIENSGHIFEKTFEHSYKEVFLASINVVHDWGANIFIKDYDKGLILARDFGNPNPTSMPGKSCGLYFQKVADSKTKVTLKVFDITMGMLVSASSDDVFGEIEREIQFRQRMKERD